MSDDDAPKAKKAPRKRDPNKPLPKPKKKASVVWKFLASGLTVVLVSWMGLYSVDVGRAPWSWSGDDWSGFLTFSQGQVEKAVEQAGNVDWEGLADYVTAETKKLYNKIPAWENKLDDRIAKLEQAEQEPAAADEPAEEAEPSAYMLGCTEFREGIREYKAAFAQGASRSTQKQGLAKAKAKFERAQEHFEVAEQEAQAAGDQPRLAEIEETREECGRYLYDCVKLDKL